MTNNLVLVAYPLDFVYLFTDVPALMNQTHSDIISHFKRILEKSMYTMTDIWLLVYFLPHISLCGFIRYLIKYKFATHNCTRVSQKLIYFYHRNSPVNVSKRLGKLKGGPQWGSTNPR